MKNGKVWASSRMGPPKRVIANILSVPTPKGGRRNLRQLLAELEAVRPFLKFVGNDIQRGNVK
jgi:hypothetical protein